MPALADDPQALQRRDPDPPATRGDLRWTLQVAATPEQVLARFKDLDIDRVTVTELATTICRLVRRGGDAAHHATLTVRPREGGAEVVLTADDVQVHRGGLYLAQTIICLWAGVAMTASHPGAAAVFLTLGALALVALVDMWRGERRRQREEFAGIARVVDYVLIPLKPGETGATYRVRPPGPDPAPAPKDRRRRR